jgi:hypothetical protein
MSSNAEFTKLSANAGFTVAGRELIAALLRGESGEHWLNQLRTMRQHEHDAQTITNRIAALGRELGDALLWGNPPEPIIKQLAHVCAQERRGGKWPSEKETEAVGQLIRTLKLTKR